MIAIGKPINGISINGLEWLLNDNNDTKLFDNKDKAITFLKEHGLMDESIESFVFEDQDSLCWM
ncbi:MAG: hypothetical protein Ta2B_13720 [Termitinemataceae bacterium]|nr:MAG: hypothetical protein Ta2B_13720 [Termitinemataceae bacterium]